MTTKRQEIAELFQQFQDDAIDEVKKHFEDGVTDAKDDINNDAKMFCANRPRGIDAIYMNAYERGYDWQYQGYDEYLASMSDVSVVSWPADNTPDDNPPAFGRGPRP